MATALTERPVDRATERTVKECRRILQRYYGDRLAGILLFGLMETGRHDAESDIDLMVLLPSSSPASSTTSESSVPSSDSSSPPSWRRIA